MKSLARLLIITGLLLYCVAGYYIWLRNDPNRLKFDTYASSTSQRSIAHVQNTPVKKEKILPTRIIIKDVGIDLPIYPAKVENNTWETTENGVSYLTSSPLPGEKGNSVIYGHNWANLFGPLVNIQTGKEVDVEFADHSKKKFTVEYTSVVSPDESTILAPSNDKRITLYTCTGFLDSKRFVVVAISK